MRAHILFTCRKLELLDYSTLVFQSLRVGFPTASVILHCNAPRLPEAIARLQQCAEQVNAAECIATDTIHHEWIERLVQVETEPFFVVDTDLVFYSSFEQFRFESHMAGFRIPEWRDAFANAITRARLHPSLLYICPEKLTKAITRYRQQFPETPFTPLPNLFAPLSLPLKQKQYFYDTGALLYHAVGGEAFTDEMKDAYCHLHFGTISDIVLPRLPERDRNSVGRRREEILRQPHRGVGAWRELEEFYNNHQP